MGVIGGLVATCSEDLAALSVFGTTGVATSALTVVANEASPFVKVGDLCCGVSPESDVDEAEDVMGLITVLPPVLLVSCFGSGKHVAVADVEITGFGLPLARHFSQSSLQIVVSQ